MSESRKAFEAWARSLEFPLLLRRLMDDRRYESLQTESAWEAWTASRAAALEEAEKVVESEALEDPHGREDAAYGLAIEHAVSAIRSLRAEDSGKKDEKE